MAWQRMSALTEWYIHEPVSELGAVVGMFLPSDFHFSIHGNLEICQGREETVQLREVLDIKKGKSMSWEVEKKLLWNDIPFYIIVWADGAVLFLVLIPFVCMPREPCVYCVEHGLVVLIAF